MKKLLFPLIFVATQLLGCGGGGGGSSGGSSSNGWSNGTPLSVYASAYENKFDSRIASTSLTQFDSNVNAISLTFGDFFQEGQVSAFVVVNRSGLTAKAYFLRWKTSETRWVDDSVTLLGDGLNGSRDTCLSPRYAYTADLNGDGKPDVYLACAQSTQPSPVKQVMYLSQSGGGYTKLLTSFTADGNSATLFDVNNDTKLDLLISNSTSIQRGEPQVYLGNGAGSFTLNGTKLITQDLLSNCGGGAIPAAVDAVFAVPSSQGRMDLILGSTGGASSVIWMKDLGAAATPRYSVCSSTSNFFPLATTARLTDVYAVINSASTTSYYLARQSSASAVTLNFFTVNEVQSGGVTSYNLQAGTHPVTISSALSDLAEMFSVAAGYLHAFDAGCVNGTDRCASWQAVRLLDIH